MIYIKNQYFIIIFIALFTYSCLDEQFITESSAKLKFSIDTVSFDTVFTTLGTVTKDFRIYNPHNQSIKVSSVYLAKSNNTFRLNIDGHSGNSINNLEIRPKDSLYIFVEATIDPINANNPLLISDSIIFETNGNLQNIKLIAYGQDVHLLNGGILRTQTWENDKPYLVMGVLLVQQTHKLTIKSGCRIHFHKGTWLRVGGTISVEGTLEEPVYFGGDRLEEFYKDQPGQWGSPYEGGIHMLAGSINNVINYAIIKNGNNGVQVDSMHYSALPVLNITNTRIEHIVLNGILGYKASIFGTNCIVARCGGHAFFAMAGGRYDFYNCTFSNVSTNHSISGNLAVALSNYYDFTDSITDYYHLERANFGNCIIWGHSKQEISTNFHENKELQSNYRFDNCIIKYEYNKLVDKDILDTADVKHFRDNIFNPDFEFKNVEYYPAHVYDYSLDTLSVAKDRAKTSIIEKYPEILNKDINGVNRFTDGAPDIGAIERVEGN